MRVEVCVVSLQTCRGRPRSLSRICYEFYQLFTGVHCPKSRQPAMHMSITQDVLMTSTGYNRGFQAVNTKWFWYGVYNEHCNSMPFQRRELIFLSSLHNINEKMINKWVSEAETDVLGDNLLQCHLVHHKSHKTWDHTRAAAVGSMSYGTALWSLAVSTANKRAGRGGGSSRRKWCLSPSDENIMSVLHLS
jgi:hypothetical protein